MEKFMSDKEIASLWMKQKLEALKEEGATMRELRDICGQNIRTSRTERLNERIRGMIDRYLKPINQYLEKKGLLED